MRESLHREFSDIVQKLDDPRLRFVTVVDTEVSRDLKHSRMFISVIGSDDEKRDAVTAIENALGHIRREIARRLPLRQAPAVSVAYDDTAERAAKLTSLIESVVPAETAGARNPDSAISGNEDSEPPGRGVDNE